MYSFIILDTSSQRGGCQNEQNLIKLPEKETLLSIYCTKHWVRFPSHFKNGYGVVHTCNFSSQEVVTGGSEIEGHPCLHSKFKVSLAVANSA